MKSTNEIGLEFKSSLVRLGLKYNLWIMAAHISLSNPFLAKPIVYNDMLFVSESTKASKGVYSGWKL